MSEDLDSGAAIEFLPDRFYVALWYFDLPLELSRFGKGGNFLAVLWRPDESREDWHLDYRFRHYRDERIYESDDYFASSQMSGVTGDEATALARTNAALRIITLMAGNQRLMMIDVHGDSEACIKKMNGLPMFHLRKVEVQR